MEIDKISELSQRLKSSMLKNPKTRNQIISDRSLFKELKIIVDSLIDLFNYSQRESMKCFLYCNEDAVIRAQDTFIDLGNSLISYTETLMYDIKPLFFKCLNHLIKRGELDIGYFTIKKGTKSLTPQKVEIATRYVFFLHRCLKLALNYLVVKGLDDFTQEFVECVLAKS